MREANAGAGDPRVDPAAAGCPRPSLTGEQDELGPGEDPGGQPMVELATHCVGEVAPTVALTVKSGQGVQALAPEPALYESPGQAAQYCAPAGAAVPGEQEVHEVDPSSAAADPGGHAAHVALLVAFVTFEALPGAQ